VFVLKKYVALLMLFFLIPVVYACDKTSTTTSFEYDYSMFVSLWVTDPSQQLNVSDEPYYLYFYGVTCTHCNAIKQEVLSTIATLSEDRVYLVSVTSILDIHSEISVTSTPAIVYVVNHQVSGISVGETQVLEIFNGLS